MCSCLLFVFYCAMLYEIVCDCCVCVSLCVLFMCAPLMCDLLCDGVVFVCLCLFVSVYFVCFVIVCAI